MDREKKQQMDREKKQQMDRKKNSRWTGKKTADGQEKKQQMDTKKNSRWTGTKNSRWTGKHVAHLTKYSRMRVLYRNSTTCAADDKSEAPNTRLKHLRVKGTKL
jgi:hypothetical protein